MKIHSWSWAKDHMSEIEQFVTGKWDFKADDVGREWREDHNMLTSVITPGFLLQPFASVGEGQSMAELRVEVVWGRAFFAVVGSCIFIRGRGEPDAEGLKAMGLTSLMYLHRWLPNRCEQEWFFKEGQLTCVWQLAEQVARALATDQVRVDIFVL
ncbi:unnamed protein product [Polarella glacialis]|uniref:Uncharacterized protein n=1 Tax=Polarella glacialis TaxID=89957 RepID=A0A813JVZ8_POLGL|nr:unnamed protein product [Polarella glacialis]CAE8608468.1 unnamed protein product [Polarella glacialis]CAE8685578.1 unnamed protein product [Polarella glacialis]